MREDGRDKRESSNYVNYHRVTNLLFLFEGVYHEFGKDQWAPERSPRSIEILTYFFTHIRTRLVLAHVRKSRYPFHVLIVKS